MFHANLKRQIKYLESSMSGLEYRVNNKASSDVLYPLIQDINLIKEYLDIVLVPVQPAHYVKKKTKKTT